MNHSVYYWAGSPGYRKFLEAIANEKTKKAIAKLVDDLITGRTLSGKNHEKLYSPGQTDTGLRSARLSKKFRFIYLLIQHRVLIVDCLPKHKYNQCIYKKSRSTKRVH